MKALKYGTLWLLSGMIITFGSNKLIGSKMDVAKATAFIVMGPLALGLTFIDALIVYGDKCISNCDSTKTGMK